jgi:dihydroflavonol-4-reductase
VDLVTGGSGFLGAHVVRALLAEGRAVRCLVRGEKPAENLAGLSVEAVRGDLRDAASLQAAVDGAERVFHVAADYRLFTRRPRDLYASNVEGTRALLAASQRAGVARFVHTSSVGALGLRADGLPGDETTPVCLEDMIGHYKRSKFLAEREAEAWSGKGLDVVVVNPTAPVGELDRKPTPTGQMIVDFLRGRMVAYVDTGLNLVDVQDVAKGHLLAAERGRRGERYVLGCENLTLLEILGRLSRRTGIPAPRRRLPHWLPVAVGGVQTAFARVFGGTPRVPLEGARMARHRMFFDSAKARRELGYEPGPVDPALGRAIDWFREHGYTS